MRERGAKGRRGEEAEEEAEGRGVPLAALVRGQVRRIRLELMEQSFFDLGKAYLRLQWLPNISYVSA